MVGAAGTTLCLAGVAWVYITNSHQAALLGLLVVYIAFFALSQAQSSGFTWAKSFPPRSAQRARRGQRQPLDSGRSDRAVLPAGGAQVWRGHAVRLLRRRHGIAIRGGHFLLSETKGQTLEQLQRRLVKD